MCRGVANSLRLNSSACACGLPYAAARSSHLPSPPLAGVLLWQMFTGSRPWAGLSHGQIIYMVAAQGA